MTDPDYITHLKARRDRLLQDVYKITVEIAQWERMKEAARNPIVLTPWDILSVRASNSLRYAGLVVDDEGTPDLDALEAYPIDKFAQIIPNCGKKTAKEMREWAIAILAQGERA